MRKHSFVAKAGLILPLLVLCVCAFGFLLAPNDPDLVDLTKKFLSPCSEFPLGTDNLGRCVLSRLLYGGRTTLGIVLVGSVTVSVLGTLAGLLMGGGKNGKNLILEGVLNAVTAIPPIAYLIIFIAAWGNSVFTMVVAVSASLMLRVIKLVQTRTGIEQGKAYVMCAVASGARPRRILFVHILPNLVWDVLHFICLSCADMTLSIVSFSFIGLGMGDNVVDWGSMVSETHHYLLSYPGLTLYPVLNTLYGAGGSLVSSIFGAKVSAAAAGGISEILAANFTKAEGLAFIFAISFNMPCVSALAATAREAHSVRWTAKIGVFYTLASLLIACIVYHIGVLLF